MSLPTLIGMPVIIISSGYIGYHVAKFAYKILKRTKSSYSIKGISISSSTNGCIQMNGNTITIDGKTYSDVIEIVIKSKGSREITVGPYTVSNPLVSIEGSTGHVSISSGNVTIGGDVTKDIDVKSGNVKVAGNLMSTTSIKSGNLTIEGSANGDISSHYGNVICKTCRKCNK